MTNPKRELVSFRFAAVRFAAVLIVSWLVEIAGCGAPQREPVVVYTALDREFSEPILKAFTRETGIEVAAKYDTESTKTVGLANAILAEARRPRCDLFWNNEILNTLRLQQHNRLAVFRPAAADALPKTYQSVTGHWYGFAARARVLIVNHDLVPPSEHPTSIRDMTLPRWKGTVGIAKPLFGTTATHATVLFWHWGNDQAESFFREVRQNAAIESGNKQVALSVGRGRLAWGITDTDDAIIELEKGRPVTIVYPDQGDGDMGTLFIPNTVSLIQGPSRHPTAERLAEFLLSADTETQLANSPSAQIPLRSDVHVTLRTESPRTVRAMEVDFEQAARSWNAAYAFLRDEFMRAE